MSVFSNLLFGRDAGPSDAERMLTIASKKRGQQADDIEDQYLARSKAFDPGAAFEKYSTGAFGDFQTQLGKQLRTLAGHAAGSGRLNSGFYDEDQGDVIRNISSDFLNDLNEHALQTAGLEQSAIGEMGQHSLAKSGEYLDLLSGQADRETARQNAKRQQRSAFTNGLLGLGGTIAGSLVRRRPRAPSGGAYVDDASSGYYG